MKKPDISRRRFVELLPLLFAAASDGPNPGSPASEVPRVAHIFRHAPEAARAIGSRYLQECPGEGTAESLLARIFHGDPTLRSEVGRLPTPELKARIDRLVSEDFAQGNVVELSGWVLSRTEARICALWQLSLPAA